MATHPHEFRRLTAEQAEFLNFYCDEETGFVLPGDRVRVEMIDGSKWYCIRNERINDETGARRYELQGTR